MIIRLNHELHGEDEPALRSPLFMQAKAVSLIMAFSALHVEAGRFGNPKARKWNQMGHNRSFPGMTSYRSSMKAAPIMAVGRMAQSNNFAAEIPSSPNRETRID
jgi:hypothetical protein